MSTKSTIYYDEEKKIHVYVELIDNTVHVAYEAIDLTVDLEIMTFEKWEDLVKHLSQSYVTRYKEPADTHLHKWVASTNDGVLAVCSICGNALIREK